MTIEEAIKILDPKTCRDALMEYMGGTWHQERALALINEAQKMGLSALHAQKTKLDRSRFGCEWCGLPKEHCPRGGELPTAKNVVAHSLKSLGWNWRGE